MTKKDQYIVEMRLLLDHWNAEIGRGETQPQEARAQEGGYHAAPPRHSGLQRAQPCAAQSWPPSSQQSQPDAGWQ